MSDGICEHAFVKDCILVMRSGLCNEEKVSPKTNKKKIHLLKVRAGARRSEIFRVTIFKTELKHDFRP